MNKKMRKIYTIFFFLCLITGFSKASLLWDINYGIDLFRKNNYKSACDYFIEYTKTNPNDKDGYYWLARSYFNLKDEKKANENFEKSYELSMKEKNIEKIDFKLNTTSNLEDYFDMAVMFFESGDLKEAKTYADLMLKINEKSPSAYFIKAKIAQLEGNNQKAIEYINQAIIFNNKLIKTNLAKSLNIKQLPEMSLEMYEVFALEAYFSNDIASAMRYCRKYLSLKSDNVDILNMLIDLYIKNNDLGLAQILLDENKDIANIYTILYQAKIYEIKNDEKLEHTLLSAYNINPNNQNVLLELGNFYLKKGDYFNSKKYFEILVNVNDELAEGYFGYIYSLIQIGKYDLAIDLIRKFISLNPQSSEGDYLLGKICDKQGNKKEALEYYSSAVHKAQNAYYYYDRAKINYELRNYEESLDDLRILEKLPNSDIFSDEIQKYYIKNYLKLGDIVNAQSYINKNQNLDKNRILYKYNLYHLYKLQGNEKLSLTQLEELERTKPVIVADYIDLSEFYYEKGEIDKAIKTLNKGIKKFPKEIDLYSKKAEILISVNKLKDAKDLFMKLDKIYHN